MRGTVDEMYSIQHGLNAFGWGVIVGWSWDLRGLALGMAAILASAVLLVAGYRMERKQPAPTLEGE